jgi:hypothetical protein
MEGTYLIKRAFTFIKGEMRCDRSIYPAPVSLPAAMGSSDNPVPDCLTTYNSVGEEEGKRLGMSFSPGGDPRKNRPGSSSRPDSPDDQEHNLFSRFNQPYTYDGGRTRSAG